MHPRATGASESLERIVFARVVFARAVFDRFCPCRRNRFVLVEFLLAPEPAARRDQLLAGDELGGFDGAAFVVHDFDFDVGAIGQRFGRNAHHFPQPAGHHVGGAVAAALKLSQELKNAVIVTIICDRGDRYLSTGVFPS